MNDVVLYPQTKMRKLIKKVGVKKLTLFLGLLILLLTIVIPQPANAAETRLNFFSCISSPATCAVYVVTDIISTIGGALIVFGGLVVKLALKINIGAQSSPHVQVGFGATLALANIGFVLGIIVIAIATILRSETYGIKKLLRNLIIMAVLVNFGLVLAGAVLNFSDQLTLYFIRQVAPSGSPSDFGDRLIEAFNPPGLLTPPAATKSASSTTSAEYAGLEGAITGFESYAPSDSAGDSAKTFVQTLLNLVFVIIFEFIIAFTLLALAIMLLIRFGYMSWLLIILPLAWLTWVFPDFSRHFSKWWDTFIRWAFFAPFVTFALYLAVYVAQNRKQYLADQLTAIVGTNANNSSAVAMNALTGQSGGGFLVTIGEQIVIIVLALGGLMFANKFGISFADTARNAVKGAGKWATGVVGSAGVRSAGGVLSRGRKAIESMEKSGVAPVRFLGRGLGKAMTAGTESQVQSATKSMADASNAALEGYLKGPSAANRIAAAQLLAKRPGGNATLARNSDLLNGTEFERFGKKGAFGDIEKTIGSSADMRAAAALPAGPERDTALREATDKFVRGKLDMGKLDIDTAFGLNDEGKPNTDPVLSQALADSMARIDPSKAASIAYKAKAGTLDNFGQLYKTSVEKRVDELNQENTAAIVKGDAKRSDELNDKMEKLKAHWGKVMAAREFGFTAGEAAAAETTVAPPPGATPKP